MKFPSTRWSVVRKLGPAKEGARALEELCEAYWFPVYGYARRWGKSPDDAEDVTQAFFAKVISGDLFAKADQERGKLRSFLLVAFKRFLKDQAEKEHALKRGGNEETISIDLAMAEERFALEPTDGSTPESLFERRWALTTLENVLDELRSEYAERIQYFETLEPFLSAPPSPDDYREAATKLKIKEATLRVAVFRLRRRYGEILRQRIADTVNSPEEVAAELDHLMSALSW